MAYDQMKYKLCCDDALRYCCSARELKDSFNIPSLVSKMSLCCPASFCLHFTGVQLKLFAPAHLHLSIAHIFLRQLHSHELLQDQERVELLGSNFPGIFPLGYGRECQNWGLLHSLPKSAVQLSSPLVENSVLKLFHSLLVQIFIFALFFFLLFLIVFFFLWSDSSIAATWGSVVLPVIWFVRRGAGWRESSSCGSCGGSLGDPLVCEVVLRTLGQSWVLVMVRFILVSMWRGKAIHGGGRENVILRQGRGSWRVERSLAGTSEAWRLTARVVIGVCRSGATPVVGIVTRGLVWEWLSRISLMTGRLLLQPVVVPCSLLLHRGSWLWSPVSQVRGIPLILQSLCLLPLQPGVLLHGRGQLRLPLAVGALHRQLLLHILPFPPLPRLLGYWWKWFLELFGTRNLLKRKIWLNPIVSKHVKTLGVRGPDDQIGRIVIVDVARLQ